MAVETWNGGTGSFLTAGNWTPATVPNGVSDVAIEVAASTVIVPATYTGQLGVNSINLGPGDGLAVDGGTLFVFGSPTDFDPSGTSGNAGTISAGNATIDISGTLLQSGILGASAGGEVFLDRVDIVGGTLASGGTGLVELAVGNRATLDGVVNSSSLSVASEAALVLNDTVINTGIIALQGPDSGLDIGLQVSAVTVTLAGAGTVELLAQSNFIGAGTGTATLANAGNLIEGAGYIGNSSSLALINAGTIDASNASYGLTLDPTAVTNTGLIEDTAAGGLVLPATIANNRGTIAAVGSGVAISLNGVDIIGGTISTGAGGSFSLLYASATLDGVTNTGLLSSIAGGGLYLADSLINRGTVLVTTGESPADIDIATAAVTLSGGGTIALESFGEGIQATTTAASLTNLDNLIDGEGQIGGGTSLALVNAGTIDASYQYGQITINPLGGVTNSGLLESTYGGLTLDTTVAGSGTIGAFGSTASVYLNGADIVGGTLASSSGGDLSVSVNLATLDGVTNTGSIVVDPTSGLLLRNSLHNTGTIALSAALGGSALTIATATLVLYGGGTIAMAGIGSGDSILAATTAILDNIDNLIEGGGQIGNYTSLALVNAGTIVATNTTYSLVIDGLGGITNTGVIESTAGAELQIVGSVSNSGTIGAFGSGASVFLDGSDIVGGTLDGSAGGTISGAATLDRVAIIGLLSAGGGRRVTLRNSLANDGTVALGGGTLRLDTAGVTLTGSGTVFLGGSVASEIEAGAAGDVLVNLGNLIEGYGTIGYSGTALSIANAGTIDASSSAPLSIDAAAGLANSGLIEGTGAGGLSLAGAPTIANAGGTLLAAGVNLGLVSNDVIGGTLASSGGGQVIVTDATLDGVRNSGSLVVAYDGVLSLAHSLVNAGTLSLSGVPPDPTQVQIATQAVTLSGGGTIALAGSADVITALTAGDTLVNLDNLIEGGGALGNNSGLVVTNAGTIAAASTATLTLFAPVSNTGLIEATAGATLSLLATIANTGTIAALGSLASIILNNSDISGGTLLTGAGGKILTSPGTVFATLDGSAAAIDIAAASTVTLPDSGVLYLFGTIDNAGTLASQSTGAGTTFTDLVIGSPVTTLSGDGVLALSDSPNNRLFNAATTADTLFNVNDTIAGAGQLGSSTASRLFGLINGPAGLIDATGSNALVIRTNGPSIANQGLIEATGAGGLQFYPGSRIVNPSGTLLAAGGTLSLGAGSDIAGGTLATSGSGRILAAGATIDGSAGAVTNLATLSLGDADTLTLLGTIANRLISLAGTATGAGLVFGGDVTLGGGGTIALKGTANTLTALAPGTTLDNLDNLIEGSGTIGDNTGLVLTNAATIAAATAGTLTLSTPVTNSGLIEGTTGATLSLLATIANTGTIAAIGSLASVILDDADISGGTLVTNAGGFILAGRGPVFSSLDGSATPIDIAAASTVAVPDGGGLYLFGTVSNFGTLAIQSTGANVAGLVIGSPVTTLTGGGVLALSDNPDNQILEVAATAGTLLNLDNTIEGAGQIGNSSASQLGLINAPAGLIDATGSSALVIRSPSVTNQGVIEATGAGGLQFYPGTRIVNTSGTLLAAGSTLSLGTGSDIEGGILATSGTGKILAAGATLDGSAGTLTNLASLSLTDASPVTLLGTIDNRSLIAVAGTASGADLILSGAVTLTGGGTIVLAGSQLAAGNAASLTILDDTLLGSGTFSGSVGIALGAAGVIESSAALALGIATLVNAGTIEASAAGLLTIAGKIIDSGAGTIAANGGTLDLAGADLVGGTLGLGSGAIHVTGASTFDGSSVSAGNQGLLQVDAGQTLSLIGTIDNAGTVALAAAASGLRFDTATTLRGGGTVALAGSGALLGTGTLDDIDNLVSGGGTIGGGLGLALGAAAAFEATGLLLLAATTSNAGTLAASGGTLVLAAPVLDAGGTIVAAAGTVSLAGADLLGGNLLADGGSFLVASLSTLDGTGRALTAQGLLTISAGAALDVLGTIGGGVTLGVASGGTLLIGGATLAGGTIALGGTDALVTGAPAVTGRNALADADASLVSSDDVLENAAGIEGGGSLGAGGLSLQNDAAGLIAGTSGTLVLDAGAAGTIANAGLIAADLAALTIASGTLFNTGTVAALGGSLAVLAGVVLAGADTLAGGTWIASGANATLTLAGSVITDDAADIILSGTGGFASGPAGVPLEQSLLRIDAAGTLDLAAGRVFAAAGALANAGTLLLAGGGFAGSGSNALANPGLITGSGTVTGTIANTGTIAAIGSTLSIGPVAGPGTLQVGAGGNLVVNGSAAGGTVAFSGAGVLSVEAPGSFADPVAGFAPGDTIDLAGITAVNSVRYDPGSGLLSLFVPQAAATGAVPVETPVATLALSGLYTASDFAVRPDSTGQGTDILPCFLAGTRLLTARGEVAVEHLRAGDVAITRDGRRPIVWIGDRRVGCDDHPHPEEVRPVRIRAGAFGAGRPARDLLLSPDHAVAWEAVLIPVKHLLNGATVLREPASAAHYFHVELDRHDLVCAEFLWTESYLDTGNRGAFSGGADWISLHPAFAPLSWADACRPLCCTGAPVAAARAHLLARAQAAFSHRPPELVVRAGGRDWRAVRRQGPLQRFLLPAGSGPVSVLSSTGMAAGGDSRMLGACIAGLAVAGRPLALDDPALAGGFYDIERDAVRQWRWTDGAARLALPPRARPTVLDLLVLQVMAGWRRAGLPGGLMAHPDRRS